MYRTILEQLKQWKEKPNRKPLVLAGARQVGKTYILQKFGKTYFSNVAYINCDDNELAKDLFMKDYDMQRIILAIGAITGQRIEAGRTLIVLDEIQEAPRGLSVLKYFCEKVPQYHVAVAGSLLGITMHRGEAFPVGKVDVLSIYPMTFDEFLLAKGKKQMVELLRLKDWDTIRLIRSELIKALREYYFVGGMPEVVAEYMSSRELQKVRSIQQMILQNYRRDFSKHAPEREVPRINMVWDSIPSQLAKENKKFIYGAVRKGARAADFEMAIEWLIDAGLIYKVNRVTKPAMPLKFYEDLDAFKLFMLDIGLLGAMVEAPAKAILIGDDIFKEYKGAFTELYVHNELKQQGKTIYYHSVANSTIEIDFIVQSDSRICPIEVKAEENVKSKSLRTFIQNNPDLKGIRISMKGRMSQDWLLNLPLYDFKYDL